MQEIKSNSKFASSKIKTTNIVGIEVWDVKLRWIVAKE